MDAVTIFTYRITDEYHTIKPTISIQPTDRTYVSSLS
jgi:hypothetical protein